VLHDAAARGEPADAAGNTDAAAVPAQDAAATVIDNYSACRANAEQLVALQNWAKETTNLADSAGAAND
jgi:hypothetical protein